MQRGLRARLAPVALVVGGVLAGGNAVGIRYTNRELDPLFGAGTRFALAAVALAVVARARRLELPRGRALLGVAVFGLLNFAGAFGFGYYALVHIAAGVGSTLLALTPLMTLAVAVLHREERIRRDALFGGALALIGVAFISNASLSGAVPVLAVAAAFASVVCFAEAAVLVRRFPPVAPIMTNAIAMGVGAAALLAASLVARETWTVPSRQATWIAFAYLVVVGSIVVFLLYLFVLRHWEASRAVYFDVLIPPVAVVLSAWLDDEPITAGLMIGGSLVLAGAYVGAMRHAGAPAAGEAPPVGNVGSRRSSPGHRSRRSSRSDTSFPSVEGADRGRDLRLSPKPRTNGTSVDPYTAIGARARAMWAASRWPP